MALNLHLLRIFATVAEHRNFSQAARELYISQPAVSKSVQELEQQIGMTLLDRSHRSIALTEAGSLLYDYAQRIFAAERAAETALEQLSGLERGHLALGASHTIGTYLLPPLMGIFHQRYPGVRLSLEIANTQQVIHDLRTRPLDLAFVEGPVSAPDLDVTPWRVDRLVVIAPAGHSLNTGQPVTFEQIAAEPYVQREPGSGTREIVEQMFMERGATLNIALELGSNQAVKEAVSAGLGISIVSEATIALERAAGVLVTLDVERMIFDRPLTQVSVRGRPQSRAASVFQALLGEVETQM